MKLKIGDILHYKNGYMYVCLKPADNRMTILHKLFPLNSKTKKKVDEDYDELRGCYRVEDIDLTIIRQ